MTGDQEKTLRVGSRKSDLALIQTKYVIQRLKELYPNTNFEIHTMSTIGDRVLNISLPKIGEKSLFTRDLEDALRNGGVDFVVHSLKDLPTALPMGMAIGAVLEREDARDALVLRDNYKKYTLQTLPQGSLIGTSSLRRTAQIRRQYPHLIVCDIRGNLNTRLAKLDAADSKFAGIILARAGLERMRWNNRISQVLEPTQLLYAVGQGALAVECRVNDHRILSMLQSLMCLSTACRIIAERSFLKTLGGGCSAPVAVWSKLIGEINDTNGNDQEAGLSLMGAVWSLDGNVEIRDKKMCTLFWEESSEFCNAVDNASHCNNSGDVEPPAKRYRNNECSGSCALTDVQNSSPPVINDDVEVDDISTSYGLDKLIAKHIDFAKRCPVVGVIEKQANNNCSVQKDDEAGTGDAIRCPLTFNVGQEFMGQCPIMPSEAKVSLASVGKCPLTQDTTHPRSDDTDCTTPSTSKCLFNTLQIPIESSVHGKCPFLQKIVQIDYADEEKPEPNKIIPLLIEDVENLFCGLYHHDCYKRDLYVNSKKLGQQLAEDLIKKGALDVMKCAQNEIHEKS